MALELSQLEMNQQGVYSTAKWLVNMSKEVDDIDKAIKEWGAEDSNFPHGPIVFKTEEQMKLFILRWC